MAGNNNKGQPMKDITCVIWCVVALVYYLCRGGEYESSRREVVNDVGRNLFEQTNKQRFEEVPRQGGGKAV